MAVHISSGVVEWICSVIALLPGLRQELRTAAVTIMAITALFAHATSSFYLTLGVQGSRVVMMSTYRLFIH
jgi:hypothetical protein